MQKRFQLIIVFVFLAGVFLRFAAVSWNDYVHGDVILYSTAAQSFGERGNFLLSKDTTVDHFYSLERTGGRFLEHNPLWPLLGAVLVRGLGLSGYGALQVLSLLSGIFVLYLSWFLARLLGGRYVALLTLALVSFSYLLIDFSGNGAFYMLQAASYLLFLIFWHQAARPWQVGLFVGVAVLLNQQSVVLLVAYGVFLLADARGRRVSALKQLLWAAAVAVAVYLPWGARNFFLFGTPFALVDAAYVWNKLGVTQTVKDGVISFQLSARTYADFISRVFVSWFPHNLYYINRKLFILAPLGYIFALIFGLQSLLRGHREQLQRFAPLVLVLAAHIALSAVWPIAKFRFFVPMLPLVFVLASAAVFSLMSARRLQYISAGAMVLAVVAFSFLTYVSIPSHTYYYGGTITTDNFGKKGEWEFIRSNPPRKP